MLNQSVLIGRVVEKIVCNESSSLEIKLAVSRTYKNANGEYDMDLVPCQVSSYIGVNLAKYCEVGDLVGIKGRLAVIDNTLKIVAEKVTFLSDKK